MRGIISSFIRGLFKDRSSSNQPEGTMRFALNLVNETNEGNKEAKANEESNKECFSLPDGYIPLGKAYIGDNQIAIWSTSPSDKKDEIGIVDEYCDYVTHVNGSLGFKITNQIDATYRLRRGCDKTVYWVDGNNNPLMFYDFNNPNDFKTGGVWDKKKFHLQSSYTDLPEFLSIKIVEGGGQLPSGSINIGIQYLDANLNATPILYTSSALNIYVDKLDGNYVEIEGSIESDMDSFNFPVTDKAVEVTVNVDQSFKYYRLVFIEFNSGDGTLTSVKYSENIPTTTNIFLYTGENYATTGSIGDVLQGPNSLGNGDSIEQIDNRLIVANTSGDSENPCNLQSIVSLINTDIVIKEVVANSVVPGNTKSPTNHFEAVGYMPGEIYSLGLVPVYDDNSEGPAYHIPGKNPSFGASHVFSPGDNVYPMAINNACINSTYVGNPTCGAGDYWGKDNYGEDLEGSNIRHHRFPYRSEIGVSMITETSSNTTTLNITNLILTGSGTIDTPCTQEQFDNEECSGVTVAEPFQVKVTVSVDGDLKYFYITIDPEDFFDPSTTAAITISEVSENYYGTVITVVSVEEETSTGTWVTTEQGVPSPKGLDYTTSFEQSQKNKTINDFKANVYGIKLSNIDLAAMNAISDKKIIGYHIVRNERKESDKTILDSAVLTPCVNSKNKNRNLWGKHPDDNIGSYHKTFNSENLRETYIANGLLSPVFARGNIKPTHSAGNPLEIGTAANQGFLNANNRLSKEFFGLIHPEHKFNEKAYPSFSRLKHEGTFAVTDRGYDTFMYQDVIDGTTYDAAIHKKKFDDDDGYSFRGGVRDSKLTYRTATESFDVPKSNIREVTYLNALHDKSFEGLSENLWNLSADNKTGIIRVTEPITTSIKDAFPYVYIERDIADPYGDFRSLPYYKITHKLETTTEVNVFEGDVYITPMRYFSSMLIEDQAAFRVDKNSVWKIVAGAAVIVGAALATIFSLGIASATLALVPQAISMIASGISEQKLIQAFQQEYSKGLKECLIDADTFQGFKYYPSRDDEIQWFGEVLTDLWFESKVNISLRHDMTDGTREYFMGAPGVVSGKSYMDFIKDEKINWGLNKDIHLLSNRTVGPAELTGIYLMKKLLGSDNSRKDNKKYLSVPPGEIYEVNPDFDRMNKQKLFFHLGIEYDCCSDCQESFPHRVWYSEQSFQEELSDNFRIFLPNNYRDIQGESGKITDLFVWQNNLYIHTEDALWHLPQNFQERVSGQLTTYIGTGDFFGIPPRKMLDNDQSSGGTQHKWATNKNEAGVFFISERERKIYKFDGKLSNIVDGLSKWFLDNIPLKAVDYYRGLGQDFKNVNNPSNPLGVGFISTYDVEKSRVIFTKKDFIAKTNETSEDPAYCEIDGQGYINNEYDNIMNVYLSYGWTFKEIVNCKMVFYRHDVNAAYEETSVGGDDITPVEGSILDSSWTISFDITPTQENPNGSWASWHSYMPRFYARNSNKFLSWMNTERGSSFWEHNIKGSYQKFYGNSYPFIVEFVSTEPDLRTKVWEYLTLYTEALKYDSTLQDFKEERFVTFNKAIFYNSRQSSGELNILVKDLSNPQDEYLHQQVENLSGDSIIIDRDEKSWNINEMRDYVFNQDEPLFNKDITTLQTNYYIDKKVNGNVIDHNKEWYDLESFRDRYLTIRLIFDNSEDIKLLFTHAGSFINDSER